MSTVVNLTAIELNNVIKSSDVPLLVDLWAPWCAPCHKMTEPLNEIAAAEEGKLRIVKVNIDEHPEVAKHFDVRGIPTMLLFRNGEVSKRIVGAMGKVDLLLQIGSL